MSYEVDFEQDRASSALAPSAQVQVAQSRAAQEVQAMLVVAKQCPRDQVAAYNRIMAACRRRSLAECAMYVYPRGGQNVTGPSIRLAEALAQNWGNIDAGIVEIDQRPGESVVMAYAWDTETNYRSQKVFTVRHERHTRHGVTRLSDPRDIYELVANQGARRLRACLLSVIPGDVVEAAVAQCEETLNGDGKEPIIDRLRKMVAAFADLGVTQEMIVKRLGHVLEATTEAELVMLRKIYMSIRDGMAPVEQWFPREPEGSSTAGSKTEQVVAALNRAKASKGAPKAPPSAPPAVTEQAEQGGQEE
jgi:hypothetical protein